MSTRSFLESVAVAASAIVVGGILAAMPVAAQTLPVCQYVDSDIDADGYGWENRASCIVTVESQEPAPIPSDGCIDNDGDGWGWDGLQVCRVAANNCFDSDPVGDGWGWDGTSSCMVVANQPPFSEIELLRSRIRQLYGSSVGAASLICSYGAGADADDFPLDLYSDGGVGYRQPGGNNYFGGWSTGFSDSDGIVWIWYNRGGFMVRAKLLLLPGEMNLTGMGLDLEGGSDCYWAV